MGLLGNKQIHFSGPRLTFSAKKENGFCFYLLYEFSSSRGSISVWSLFSEGKKEPLKLGDRVSPSEIVPPFSKQVQKDCHRFLSPYCQSVCVEPQPLAVHSPASEPLRRFPLQNFPRNRALSLLPARSPSIQPKPIHLIYFRRVYPYEDLWQWD